ncbi:MAG: 30S ribosomal protein S1 [Planctomycetota bacterium]|jgi:ribosomal protein S1
MCPKVPSEKDPVQAELEAALADGSLLDIDLSTDAGKGVKGDDLRKGVVAGIDGDDIFVELGPRMQGGINASEVEDPPAVGQTLEFTMHGQKDGLWLLSRRKAKALSAWNNLEQGSHVEAVVKATNAGGLEVEVGPLSGFMPASQAADHHVEDLSTLVGQKLTVEVIELDQGRKRLVVSRRKVAQAERESARQEIVGSLVLGDKVAGSVTRIEPFGAFVDIGGVEGMVHVSQITRSRVEHPEEKVKVGDRVEAEVIKIEQGGKRIGLSMKNLEPDPWSGVDERFGLDTMATVKVVRLTDFGAFCELEPGVDGLLHISQMAGRGERVNRPSDLFQMGQEIEVRISAIDPITRRIGLSRLDNRGALIGSEEAAGAAEADRVVRESSQQNVGTNLGALFKKALGDQG